ncbi:tRNA dihydrouridine synthase DusB [Acinetobacter junii]|jgi:tRNA-dihydrouridine synthase B|uniref:tRNA dihydrouridine synthase DusB n=1 Tax=Acinetobacter junii TaxID=40215 RepID=UPI00057AA081|nr:tRNA dihydrouridine synthase DusB [Acinetobacter junii]NIZ93851.1 tRNA dihydrouridine synthase DusB [Kineococcus rubinsiae]MCE6002787.1 tRNA dihydrouridine synthase DusB [Acinetobacter junii]MCU4405975.1 tRNA dihydrouridine synthase DusB [Acinetobacter junii]MDH1689601.1 tRNA dihydrouridine synthase DusB [Acinetobacter junii]MDH1857818.1 tRNA dihydrouridine synthase DusB [Acinetobacter junii]
MYIGPYQLSNNLIVAPMAGVTDRPFRTLCKYFGAGHAVSEMMTADKTLRMSKKSLYRANFDGELAPISAQIAGSDPEQLAEAARYQIANGAQIVDINMGCPAKKVCNKLAGSALLQDEDLVARILDAVVAAVDVPVTLKTRLGFLNGEENILRVAKRAEDSGIAALALHGRTREDMYLNTARYELIREVKKNINIPLIANGDIDSPEKAKYVLDYTGADAVMIGRAAQGRPWIFREIAHYLETGEHLAAPEIVEVKQVLMGHLAELYQFYGEYSGCRIARKHIAWYTKGLRSSNEFRQNMYKVENTADQAKVVESYFDQLLDQGRRMSDVQVEQVNLLEIK